MYLKKIYINGFKSFAEKTEVVVENGITAIVGPNGSGKSNISDAVKWVLGEQSAKSLRGGKMEDVIFAGTQKRPPLAYAEVNLIFDNESGQIPIDYKEVSVKRKLYKTGESEYYINKQQCRLKDVKELFMDTGIGRDGYSFIGQGRVEDILSPNSETRRQVFEEASGIVKYKTRKEESERKLEKTNDNLDRVHDILHELEERIVPLEEQSIKAKKYIDIKENLKKYELNYLATEYEKHTEQLKALNNQKNTATEQKIKLQNKRDHLSEIIVSQKESIDDIKLKITELEETRDLKNKDFDGFNNMMQVYGEKKLLYFTNIENIKAEKSELINRNEELNFNLKVLAQEKESFFERLNSDTEKFNSMNEEIKSYKNEMDVFVTKIEQGKNELFELHKAINKLQSQKSTIISFLTNDEDRIHNLESEITLENNDRENKLSIVAALKEEQDKIRTLQTDITGKLKDYSHTLSESENKKQKLSEEIQSKTNELNSAQSKLNVLANMDAYYEGYYKSIKTVMNNKDKEAILKSSILGTVADIIKTEKEYETAIEVALGSAIQNIIVNTDTEAENIIEYLKKNKIGRVTFLPINMLQERSLNKSEQEILHEKCVINTGDKLVETNEKYKDVIKHLLGRIVITDNLNNGFKISKKLGNSVKIVTLQGDVINAGGSVTGGHISNNQNLLGRKREIEEYRLITEKAEHLLKEKNKELNALAEHIRNLNEKIQSLNNSLNENNNTYDKNNSKISIFTEQTEKSDNLIQKYASEKEYILTEKNNHVKEIDGIILEIENLETSIKEKEKEIESAISLSDENKNKFEEYNSVVLNQRDIVAQINQDIKLNEEKTNSIASEIKRNNENIFTKEENLQNIHAEIASAENTIEENKVNAENLSEEIRIINEGLFLEKENLNAVQNDIYEYQNKINDANKQITEILDDENKMNVKIERENTKIEEISAKLWEDYEINYAMAIKYKDDSISQSRLYGEVNSCRKAIKELGNVNLNSIEEYEEVKQRFDFLKSQQKDLSDAKEKLHEVIKQLEIQMNDKFIEEFANIRAKFNDVFKRLFNGGSGDVYLEDENDALNCNIEIAVQPPGKKLSKISLLSGGEKALTAIALLFSILKTKPTPFCVLDEIEAALDDSNINRFSDYLKEISEEMQFIVITHRKGTMEYADTLYGATMEEKGVTKLVSMKLSDAI